MEQPSSYLFSALCSFCFFFFFIFLTIPTSRGDGIPFTSSSTRDIINQTCNKCAELSVAVSSSFCSASLDPIPVSHVTNLQGLAIISMELALENATNTVSLIKELMSNGSYGPFESACLRSCSNLYNRAVDMLVDSVGAFMIQQFGKAATGISAVIDAAAECEDGFKEEEGSVVSPLTEENYSLAQLCDIGLCIIELVSSTSSLTLW